MKLPKNKFLRWVITVSTGSVVSVIAGLAIFVGTQDYRKEAAETTKVFQHAIDNLQQMQKASALLPDTGFGYKVLDAEHGTSDWNGTMGGIVGALCKPAKEIYVWPKLTHAQIGDALYYIDFNIHESARRKFPSQAGMRKQWVPLVFGPGLLTPLF